MLILLSPALIGRGQPFKTAFVHLKQVKTLPCKVSWDFQVLKSYPYSNRPCPRVLTRLDTFDGAKPRFLYRGKKRRSVSTLSPSAALGALSLSKGIPRALVRQAHHPERSRGTDRGVEWVDLQAQPHPGPKRYWICT